MKFALLSDIHANSLALQAVLASVKKKEINTLLITGDFVGYYFSPQEVLNLLKPWHVVAIRGNHEEMLLKAQNDKVFLNKITGKYGSGLKIALDTLNDEQIEWLESLPETREYSQNDTKLLLCHGSPWDLDEYVYPDSSLDIEKIENLNHHWIILGHTHYPMKRTIGQVTLINPGSVGQPRNKQPGAHWASLDTETEEIHYYCEDYDYSSVIKDARIRHPELPYLANVLERM